MDAKYPTSWHKVVIATVNVWSVFGGGKSEDEEEPEAKPYTVRLGGYHELCQHPKTPGGNNSGRR